MAAKRSHHHNRLRRLRRRWLQRFPERLIEHVIEDWKADSDAPIKRVLDFCGLDLEEDWLGLSRAST